MQIKRLRLTGFKRFVDAADLRIERGLTGVVGPNGCGKSNLLEALRCRDGPGPRRALRCHAPVLPAKAGFDGAAVRSPQDESAAHERLTSDRDRLGPVNVVAEREADPAVGRRAGADRDRADLRAVPDQSRADLRARRGRCPARRRQRRALLHFARYDDARNGHP